MSASIISRPDLVSTLEATEDSFTPASSSTLCSRWDSRARSSIAELRWRVRSRSARNGSGGMKLGRTRPCSSSDAPQIASATSVLRPGTLRMCRALITHTSGTDASNTRWTGFPSTPVASIPTTSRPARRASRPAPTAARSWSRTPPPLRGGRRARRACERTHRAPPLPILGWDFVDRRHHNGRRRRRRSARCLRARRLLTDA